MRTWLEKVDLKYYSPHKFRHGNAVYSLENAKTVADLKAISLNLMHSDIKITDSVYAVLDKVEVKNRINGLGKKINKDEVRELLQEFIKSLD